MDIKGYNQSSHCVKILMQGKKFGNFDHLGHIQGVFD